ncbi:MAG: 5'/3'-nucleotidase SurE [Spirochaetales bacterium]|nr:5'/3'-nucleotidase SurE [Spirochaetales bacterium]
MRLLLTNDDGIHADGLRILADRLSLDHEVWIVAPESERSACAMSISIRKAVRVRRLAEREFSVDGTPVDCVLTGLLTLIGKKIDAVVSGVNRGPNLGTDILYSGTVAAARQGALMGKPSFAISLFDETQGFDFQGAALYVARELPRLTAAWTDDHFLNINVPAGAAPPFACAVTAPGRRIYGDHYETYQAPAPDGALYCFLQGDDLTCRDEEESDYRAVREGLVSLSPIAVHPESHGAADAYRTLLAERERTPS